MKLIPGHRTDEDTGDGARRARSMRARAEALTVWSQTQVEQLEGRRSGHASVEIGFRWLARDREIAGGVLGGGLAYRLFFWVLALSVLMCGGLGLFARAGDDVDSATRDVGMPGAVAHSVATAATESSADRWWLIVLGAYLTLWFSWSLLRSLRLVHAAAWKTQVRPLRNAPRALLYVLAAPVALVALLTLAGWVRAHTGTVPGLLATLAVGIGLGVFWLVISASLPAADDAPWTAFVPGAVIIAVGTEVLHLLTVYYLARRLASSSALYGTLGLAGTALFYLFLIGRGAVWAAELNAVAWGVRRERATARPPSPGS